MVWRPFYLWIWALIAGGLLSVAIDDEAIARPPVSSPPARPTPEELLPPSNPEPELPKLATQIVVKMEY